MPLMGSAVDWTWSGESNCDLEKDQKKCPELGSSCLLNSDHSKDTTKSELLEHVFAWIIKLRITGWDHLGLRVAPKSFPDKERADLRTETEGKEKMNQEAEISATYTRAKGPQTASSPQSWQTEGKTPPYGLCTECSHADSLIWGFWLP